MLIYESLCLSPMKGTNIDVATPLTFSLKFQDNPSSDS